jgi:hypothetical protein
VITSHFVLVSTHNRVEAPVLAVYVFYNGSEEDGRARFKPLYDISAFLGVLSSI